MPHTNTAFEENFNPLILGSFVYGASISSNVQILSARKNHRLQETGFYTLLVMQAVCEFRIGLKSHQ